MFAWLQKNAAAGLLLSVNLKPVGARKFLLLKGVPGLSAGGFLTAIIRYFLNI
jgi:hypothetical protein